MVFKDEDGILSGWIKRREGILFEPCLDLMASTGVFLFVPASSEVGSLPDDRAVNALLGEKLAKALRGDSSTPTGRHHNTGVWKLDEPLEGRDAGGLKVRLVSQAASLVENAIDIEEEKEGDHGRGARG